MTAAGSSCRGTRLFVEIQDYQWPIIYSSDYSISLCGLERLQSYDVAKGRNIFLYLKDAGMLDYDAVVRPIEAQAEDLLAVHSKSYLNNLKLTQFIEGVSQWGSSISGLADLPPVGLLPNFLVDSKILRPLRFQTGGSVLAAKLAVERGWAINLGGGFHHCCANRGGGFCAYADISLAVRLLLDRMPELEHVMIIDLDASQGNGPERDFLSDDRVYIFDMYNRQIYPQDGFAKRGIKRKVELLSNTCDEDYLQLLRRHLDEALTEICPNLVIYIAGASVLASDPSGRLSLTDQGVIERDQVVIQKMRTRGIPVAMLTGGGYGKSAATVMAQSILNLYHLGLISAPEAEIPRPIVLARHPSLASQRNPNDDLGSFWSRFRSISVTNFAYLTANANTSTLSKAESDRSRNSAAEEDELMQSENDADADCEVQWRNEMSRCESLPNMDANKRVCDFDTVSEEDFPTAGHQD